MPVYSIRKLIYEKYGEDRYALGCEIVARWLQFETKDRSYNQEYVQQLCSMNYLNPAILTRETAEALRRLFGLKDSGELFEL